MIDKEKMKRESHTKSRSICYIHVVYLCVYTSVSLRSIDYFLHGFSSPSM